jgi:hypothetical protein
MSFITPTPTPTAPGSGRASLGVLTSVHTDPVQCMTAGWCPFVPPAYTCVLETPAIARAGTGSETLFQPLPVQCLAVLVRPPPTAHAFVELSASAAVAK